VGAGLIEGFVTGAPAVPVALKAVVGIAAWVGFLAWALGRGRAAVAEGWTGALEELRPSWVPLDPLAPAAPSRPRPAVPAALHTAPSR
jgi:hypothetical protein